MMNVQEALEKLERHQSYNEVHREGFPDERWLQLDVLVLAPIIEKALRAVEEEGYRSRGRHDGWVLRTFVAAMVEKS